MAEDMDNFIRSTLNERYTFVKKTLNEYHQAIENMTAVLLDIEVIEGKKVRSIIADYEKENNLESRLAHGDKIAAAIVILGYTLYGPLRALHTLNLRNININR